MRGFRWTPTIGDPTFVGWLTVAAYFLVGALCLRAFMAEKSGKSRPYLASIFALVRVMKRSWPAPPLPARRAGIWLVISGLMFALGVNKQLDLQTLLTDLARALAHYQGWYDDRHPIQIFFILLMLTGGLGNVP